MTPEERARDFMARHALSGGFKNNDVMFKAVEWVITKAIEEEREACASVADAWVWPDKPDTPDSNLASHVAKKIARKIRARGEK